MGLALRSCLNELHLLTPELRHNINVLGGEELSRTMDGLLSPTISVTDEQRLSMVDIWSAAFPHKGNHLRKLSFFSDKEGKTRVIAILDYWSQTALKPYHDCIADILRALPTDCTFDQGKFLQILSEGPFYSMDLSNATDRMPIALQERIFAYLFGDERAAAWRQLLISVGFRVQGLTRPVKYGAGQPMGAYSSWMMLALTHHFIVK